MPLGLHAFSPRQLVLWPAEADAVLELFFPLDGRPAPRALTFEDLAFAQGLLVAAVDEERRIREEEPPEELPAVVRVAAGWPKARPLAHGVFRRTNPAWFHVPEAPDESFELGEPARVNVSIRYRARWMVRMRGIPLL